MRYAFYLSGENLKLGIEEIKAFVNNVEVNGRIAIVDCEKFDFTRLAYTKKVTRLIVECKEKELLKKLKSADYGIIGAYCVRAINFSEKKAADAVWNSFKAPEVNLEKPEHVIQVICENGSCYSGILEYDNQEEFSKRRPHLRPGFHPSSMLPKLARALVNLSRIKEGNTLLDPFCGTGGILIEAGFMGIQTIGLDINEEMLFLAERNLKKYTIKNYQLTKGDATKELPECDAIVTDLPYGKSSSLFGKNRINLYNKFLKNAYSRLNSGRYCVLMIPNIVNVSIGKFKKESEIEHYVNKSLTRKILVLKKLN